MLIQKNSCITTWVKTLLSMLTSSLNPAEITEGLASPDALEELLTSLQGVPQAPPRVSSPKPPLVPTSAPAKPVAEQLARTASAPLRSAAEMGFRTTAEQSLRTELSDSQSGGESPGGGTGEDLEEGGKRKRLSDVQVQELERIFQKEPTGPPTGEWLG